MQFRFVVLFVAVTSALGAPLIRRSPHCGPKASAIAASISKSAKATPAPSVPVNVAPAPAPSNVEVVSSSKAGSYNPKPSTPAQAPKPEPSSPAPKPKPSAPAAPPKSSSKPSSSSAPKSTAKPSSGNVSSSSSSTNALFPAGNLAGSSSSAWSTSKKISGALPLSDSTFRPIANMDALSHNTVSAPDGVSSIEAIYPQGSAALSGKDAKIGGFSFYAPGASEVDVTTAKELTLAYSVLFPEGFDFNLGGKIPGMYGGDTADGALSCSGGRRDTTCWSARFMWRTNGAAELYTYLPPGFSGNKALCNVAPLSDCNDVYGASSGRGAFNFVAGKRTTVSQRILLNDAGKSNGEIEVFHDGQSVFTVNGLTLRDSSEGKFRGIQMQTFFGGHDANPWGSPKDQSAYFSDFSIAILQTL